MKIGTTVVKNFVNKIVKKINFDSVLEKINLETSKDEFVQYVFDQLSEKVLDLFNKIKFQILVRTFVFSLIFGFIFGVIIGIFVN